MHWELFNNPPTTPLGFYGHSPPLSPQADLSLQMGVEKADVTYIEGSGPCSFAQARGLSLGEAWDGVLQGIFLLLRDTWRSRRTEIRTQQYWLTPYLLQAVSGLPSPSHLHKDLPGGIYSVGCVLGYMSVSHHLGHCYLQIQHQFQSPFCCEYLNLLQ